MSIVKSLAQMTSSKENTRQDGGSGSGSMFIYTLGDDGSVIFNHNAQARLQYFPETISLSRGVEYATKKTLGSSHPIYQWLHGSERTLSMKATFTRDTVPTESNGKPVSSETSAASTVENIANNVSNFIKNPITAGINALRGTQGSENDSIYDVDIVERANWLMSKTFPLYGQARVKPPSMLAVEAPNAGISSYVSGFEMKDTFFCLMTRCDIEYTSFFRTGHPRVIEVSLTFEECIQKGNNWGFISSDSVWQPKAANPGGLSLNSGNKALDNLLNGFLTA